MKKLLILSLAGMMLAASSCTDKENEPAANDRAVYSGTSLAFTLNSVAEFGKEATVATGADGSTRLTLKGQDLDLATHLGSIHDMIPSIPATVATPGVLPGSPELTLEFTPSASGDFAGSGEAGFCTYSYSGNISQSALKCAFTDVRLKDTTLAGTYRPATVTGADGTELPAGFILNWESTDSITMMTPAGRPATMNINSFIATMLARMAGIDPSQKVAEHLDRMVFGTDGNVTVAYVKDGAVDTTPSNVCHYAVTAPGTLKAFINPAAIMIAANSGRSRAEMDLNIMVKALTDYYFPMLRDGITMHWTLSDNDLRLWLDAEFAKPLLTSLGAILEVPEVQAKLIEVIEEKVPNQAAMITGILPQLPAVIKGTTRFECGLSLTKN